MRVHINPSVTVLLWSPPDHGIVRVGQEESHRHDTQVVLNILERGGVETVTFPSIRRSPLFFLFFLLSGQILARFCDCLQYQHAKMEGKLSHLNVNGGEGGGGR